MHRAWDALLWALLAALAVATAMAIVSTESAALFSGVEAILIIGPVGALACGLVIALEAAERGQQPRLAQMVRWAVLMAALCAGLALMMGSTRTSPLVQLVLLAAAGAAAGIQALTLGRLSIIGRWGRFARRFAILAGCFGVLVPAVLMASIGLVTWMLAMVTRGEAPLADEGALPFAEFLGVAAVATACTLVMPLSVVTVACAVLGAPLRDRPTPPGAADGPPAGGPPAPRLLAVRTTCPRCGDRRPRPFGGPWICRSCGLGATVDAPEMACICGTSLVGVAGDRCPRCGSAIRTRWGGPIAVSVPSEPAAASAGMASRRPGVLEAVAIVLLVVAPLAPLALTPAPPPGELSDSIFGWLLPVSVYCGVLWAGMLVIIHAFVRRRAIPLAVTASTSILVAAAAWAAPLSLGLTLHSRFAIISLTTLAAVVSVVALVARRARARGPMEHRLRGGALLLAGTSTLLLLIEAGSTWREEPSIPMWPQVNTVSAVGRLANWTICLAMGTGFALVVGRRIERRRRAEPRALGLAARAALEVACPRCTAELRVPLRGRLLRCENCDLLIHASAFEGRCRCGQALAGVSGERCPECGRRVAPEGTGSGGGAVRQEERSPDARAASVAPPAEASS